MSLDFVLQHILSNTNASRLSIRSCQPVLRAWIADDNILGLPILLATFQTWFDRQPHKKFGWHSTRAAILVLNGCRCPLPEKRLTGKIVILSKPLPVPGRVTTPRRQMQSAPAAPPNIHMFEDWLRTNEGMTPSMIRCRLASIQTIEKNILVPLCDATTDDILTACFRVQNTAVTRRINRGVDSSDDTRRQCTVMQRMLRVVSELIRYGGGGILNPRNIDMDRLQSKRVRHAMPPELCLDKLPAAHASTRRQPCATHVQAMLAVCQTARESVIMLLLSQAGLRSHAIRHLQLCHVWNCDSQTVETEIGVPEKNGTTRYVILDAQIQDAVRVMILTELKPLLEAHGMVEDGSTPIFLAETLGRLQPMSRQTLYTLLGTIATRTCIDKTSRWLTPHAFRRYLGSELSAYGNSNAQISRFFNHQSMTVTRKHYNVPSVKDQLVKLDTRTIQQNTVVEKPVQQNLSSFLFSIMSPEQLNAVFSS